MTVLEIVKPDDVSKLIPLAIREAKEIGIKEEKINFVKLRKALKACATEGVIFVSKEGKHWSGFIALLPIETFWGDEKTLCNLCYYVEPEYRNGAGLKLLRAARDFAKEARIELNIFVDTDASLERKDNMFMRVGFQRRGGTYRSK